MKKIFILSLLMLSGVLAVHGQEITITGKVSDAQGPLPGVNVIVKGTTTGVITDFDGLYSLTAGSDATLIYSFLGYAKKEVAVNGNTTLNVTLEELPIDSIMSRKAADSCLLRSAGVSALNISPRPLTAAWYRSSIILLSRKPVSGQVGGVS